MGVHVYGSSQENTEVINLIINYEHDGGEEDTAEGDADNAEKTAAMRGQ